MQASFLYVSGWLPCVCVCVCVCCVHCELSLQVLPSNPGRWQGRRKTDTQPREVSLVTHQHTHKPAVRQLAGQLCCKGLCGEYVGVT